MVAYSQVNARSASLWSGLEKNPGHVCLLMSKHTSGIGFTSYKAQSLSTRWGDVDPSDWIHPFSSGANGSGPFWWHCIPPGLFFKGHTKECSPTHKYQLMSFDTHRQSSHDPRFGKRCIKPYEGSKFPKFEYPNPKDFPSGIQTFATTIELSVPLFCPQLNATLSVLDLDPEGKSTQGNQSCQIRSSQPRSRLVSMPRGDACHLHAPDTEEIKAFHAAPGQSRSLEVGGQEFPSDPAKYFYFSPALNPFPLSLTAQKLRPTTGKGES